MAPAAPEALEAPEAADAPEPAEAAEATEAPIAPEAPEGSRGSGGSRGSRDSRGSNSGSSSGSGSGSRDSGDSGDSRGCRGSRCSGSSRGSRSSRDSRGSNSGSSSSSSGSRGSSANAHTMSGFRPPPDVPRRPRDLSFGHPGRNQTRILVRPRTPKERPMRTCSEEPKSRLRGAKAHTMNGFRPPPAVPQRQRDWSSGHPGRNQTRILARPRTPKKIHEDMFRRTEEAQFLQTSHAKPQQKKDPDGGGIVSS